MDRWAGRVALVTGASSGIGHAVAERLTKLGMKVVGCARNITKIQELADSLKEEKGSLLAVKCDLSEESEILAMFEVIKDKYGGVDILLNNAGAFHDAPLLEGSTEFWKNMLNINVLALAICTREAVKSMRDRRVDDGHIIHINSIHGHHTRPNPTSHFYGLTKFAVRAHLEGLRNELRAINSHIRASEISPGLVKTDIIGKAVGEEAAKKVFETRQSMDPGDIADALVYILSAPAHVQVHDVIMRPTTQTH